MAFLGFAKDNQPFSFNINDLVTHGICVASSGKGKTGNLINLIEEATLSGVNSIIFDQKGDLVDCCLPFHYLSENITSQGKDNYKSLRYWVEDGKNAVTEQNSWLENQTKDSVRNLQYKNSAEFKVIAPESVKDLPEISDLYSFTAESKPKVTVFYLRHLTSENQEFVITSLLEKIQSWLKTSKSSSLLRNLLVIDEAAGVLPPAPKNPLTKAPLATIIAQARSQGLGVLLATQNPNDLDYKALSNIGTWFLGGLRKRDMQRDLKVIIEDKELDSSEIYNLPPRNFMALTKDGKATAFTSRCTMSYLAGPINRENIAFINALHTKEKVATGISTIAFNLNNIPESGYLASLEFKLENGSWVTCLSPYNDDLFFMVNKGNNSFLWDTSKNGRFCGEVDIRLNIINKHYVPILSKVKVDSTI